MLKSGRDDRRVCMLQLSLTSCKTMGTYIIDPEPWLPYLLRWLLTVELNRSVMGIVGNIIYGLYECLINTGKLWLRIKECHMSIIPGIRR